MTLADVRTLVRRDLHDEDSSAYRWTDAELDRHIQRAVRELSVAVPRENSVTLTTTAGSRDLSVASLSNLLRVEAVEYPTGRYPPSYVPFSLWAGTLTLLVEGVPVSGQEVKVYYQQLHTLDAVTSTLPSHLEEVAALGATGYAALEWASFATNRVNVGGPQVWHDFQTWGQQHLELFHRALERLAANNALRARQLYSPAVPAPSQSTDWGP